MEKRKEKKKQRQSFYQAIWRWHFYAGIIFAPFIIILAISGSVYLFKPQIEDRLYKDYYFVKQQEGMPLTSTQLLANVQTSFPDYSITSIKYVEGTNRSTEIGVIKDSEQLSVYVNPYNGEILGSLPSNQKVSEIFKRIHSELLIGGTIANRFVELAACWAFILVITGLYLWWPRNKASIWGTFLPRWRSKQRLFWRDFHAVPAFWLSLCILVLIGTGLPWTSIMGGQIDRLANATNTGYPPFALSFLEKPESTLVTEDVAEDVPWAAQKLPVPVSHQQNAYTVSLEQIVELAKSKSIQKPYTISMPQGEAGVYTISTSQGKPSNSATLHVNQYSGEVLTDVRFADYGLLAKGITVGIALHEGRLFGSLNQIIGLLVCLGLMMIIVSSYFMWKKRKPEGKLGAPMTPKNRRTSIIVFFIMIGLGLLMPLVGLSIIIIYFLDTWVFSKLPRLKAWVG